jgi:NAD(P)-dependent dehydrogenase (short-subunit alcohol dehydrogenase family)
VQDRNLLGQTALVTGAASGFGGRVASDLAAAGALVGVLDRDADGVAEVTERILATGGRAYALLADVTDRTSAEAAVARLAALRSRLDILVTCAAVPLARPLLAMDVEDWRTLTTINVGGTLAATAAVAPVMERARYGRIAHLDWCTWHRGDVLGHNVPGGALAPLTRSFALRLGRSGVTVNCVTPGPVQPSGGTPAGSTPATHLPVTHSPGRLAVTVPTRRQATAEEVAGAVRFLVSADAGFVTGQVFHLSGADGCIPGPRTVPGVA